MKLIEVAEAAQSSDWFKAKKDALEIQQLLDERGYKDVKISKVSITMGNKPTQGYAVTFMSNRGNVAFHVSAQGEQGVSDYEKTGCISFFVHMQHSTNLAIDGLKYAYALDYPPFTIDRLKSCISTLHLAP